MPRDSNFFSLFFVGRSVWVSSDLAVDGGNPIVRGPVSSPRGLGPGVVGMLKRTDVEHSILEKRSMFYALNMF